MTSNYQFTALMRDMIQFMPTKLWSNVTPVTNGFTMLVYQNKYKQEINQNLDNYKISK